MEVAAFTGWVVVSVVASLCAVARVRQICLRAQTASLRDRGEYQYSQLNSRA